MFIYICTYIIYVYKNYKCIQLKYVNVYGEIYTNIRAYHGISTMNRHVHSISMIIYLNNM